MALADVKKEITDEDMLRLAGRRAGGSERRGQSKSFGRGCMSPEQWTIAVLPGDGIGPEVTRAATTILQDCAREFGFRVNLR